MWFVIKLLIIQYSNHVQKDGMKMWSHLSMQSMSGSSVHVFFGFASPHFICAERRTNSGFFNQTYWERFYYAFIMCVLLLSIADFYHCEVMVDIKWQKRRGGYRLTCPLLEMLLNLNLLFLYAFESKRFICILYYTILLLLLLLRFCFFVFYHPSIWWEKVGDVVVMHQSIVIIFLFVRHIGVHYVCIIE